MIDAHNKTQRISVNVSSDRVSNNHTKRIIRRINRSYYAFQFEDTNNYFIDFSE